MKHPLILLMTSVATLLATPSLAQDNIESSQPVRPDSVFDGTHVTVGIGGSYSPSYDGSDDYAFSVLPVITGSIEGIEFTPRGPGLAIDLVPDKDEAKIDLVLGIVATLNFDRTRQIKDQAVESLGERDTAFEIGPTAGFQVNRVLNPYDSLTLVVDAKWDVAGAHEGMIVAPSITYFTPLSKSVAVSLALTAEHVDDDYADYYFSIPNLGGPLALPILPRFDAEGGWKNVGATIFTAVDLDGDITNGGLGLFAIGGYSRLLEDAKRSPVTSLRGDADQWFGALGIGYTF